MTEPTSTSSLAKTPASSPSSSSSSAPPPSNQHAQPQPYPHQVGGHGQLAISRPGQVLKPLVEKEKKFYQFIHSDQLPTKLHWIRTVTPKFYGEFDYPQVNSSDDQNTPAQRESKSASYISYIHQSPTSSSFTVPQWRYSHDNGASTPAANISPWAAQMRLRMEMLASDNASVTAPPSSTSAQISSQRVTEAQTSVNNNNSSNNPTVLRRRPSRCIALEDVNRKFTMPCVMDCKIGVRHYDDDATPEKRRRHIDKANRTTSAKCGVRYTGMQSFKRVSAGSAEGIYETTNKYDGRKLKEDDLIAEATWFFHDGFDIHTDCIHMMLERLVSLRCCLLHQRHFFFYSSSLLLVYEGAAPSVAKPRVEVRMIDFAHTVASNGKRDDGYLKGLNYLIHLLSQILLNEQETRRCLPKRVTCSSTMIHQ